MDEECEHLTKAPLISPGAAPTERDEMADHLFAHQHYHADPHHHVGRCSPDCVLGKKTHSHRIGRSLQARVVRQVGMRWNTPLARAPPRPSVGLPQEVLDLPVAAAPVAVRRRGTYPYIPPENVDLV